MGKSSGGGGGPSQTTTTRSVPWGPESPYLKEYLGLLNQLTTGEWSGNTNQANLMSNPLPQQQIAGFTPWELLGLADQASVAPQQLSLGNAGAQQAQNILSGQYLNPASNPELTAYYNAAAQPVTNQYEAGTAPTNVSQAIQSGAFGGSADIENRDLSNYNFGNNLQQLAANIYEPAYSQGLDQITKTLALEPTIASGLNIPGETLLQAGGIQQEQQQNVLNNQYGNAYQNAMWPYQQLGYFGSGLTGLLPAGGGSVTQGYSPDGGGKSGGGIGGGIGGGLAGGELGSMFGPWGTAGGGILGALLGAFA